MRRYDPHVSWPYTKCNGARADGERCQARVDSGGMYCHHHDPARKSPTSPVIASATARSSSTSPAERGIVPDETNLAGFAEAFRRVREARRPSTEGRYGAA